MKKLYIKQLYCYDNWFYFEDMKVNEYYKDIFIYGNREYVGINGDIIKVIYDKLLNYSDYEKEVYYKNNLAALIIDEVKTNIYIKLSLKSAISIARVIKDYEQHSLDEYDAITNILSIIYKKEYYCTCIRGCCQSDWNYLFIPLEKEKQVNYIEAVYFNTGYEYAIFISDEDYEYADDYDDYDDVFYTNLYDGDDVKNYVLKYYGGNDINKVILFSIDDVKHKQIIDVTYKRAYIQNLIDKKVIKYKADME